LSPNVPREQYFDFTASAGVTNITGVTSIIWTVDTHQQVLAY
jgi:hypothetical protein